MAKTIVKKTGAPILRAALISDSGGDIGDIKSWDPDPDAVVPVGQKIGLVITSMDNADNLTPLGHFMAEKVWNCVWNDYADFQFLGEKEYIPGKVYFDTVEGARLCNERCQMAVMGVASDTFAQVVGSMPEQNQIPIAVAGWVLAYVDKEYPCGTPLTNDENGNLTEMTLEEKQRYPERIVATYKKKEAKEEFGTEKHKIVVNGRHWVQVK